MAINVSSVPGCGGTASGIAGFSIPFHVWTNGTHVVKATWTFNFSAYASGLRFQCTWNNGTRSCRAARAQLSVWTELTVVDHVTGAVVKFGPSKYSVFQLVSRHGSRGNYSSSFSATLTCRASLRAGTQYDIRTWIGAEVFIYGATGSFHGSPAYANFIMAGPSYGSSLDRVSVR